MKKKKKVSKKTAKKSFMFDHAEFFTYEAFCVAELLAERDNITIKGMADVKGFAYPPDLYAPDGIPSLELDGPTVIDVKKTLSYSTVNGMTDMYEKHGANYNIVVVYYESTVSNIPKEAQTQGKKLLYISFESLNNTRRAVKKPQAYIAEKAKRDWKDEREEILRKAKEMVAQDNNEVNPESWTQLKGSNET